ncbi:EscS/YscS/HrcS family type III secretion system export apparatus protein [Betaproteobacteria bacterium]|nr:EscS/YscS/HrcS family type III secretion system export apparatus protein [Betaproteobacteria bacterium]
MDYSALHYAKQAMYLVLMLSMPPIVVASVVGLLLSLFQAITQLQEQTLSFGVKLIAVSITLFLTAGWFGGELLRFGREIFDRFYLIL